MTLEFKNSTYGIKKVSRFPAVKEDDHRQFRVCLTSYKRGISDDHSHYKSNSTHITFGYCGAWSGYGPQ